MSEPEPGQDPHGAQALAAARKPWLRREIELQDQIIASQQDQIAALREEARQLRTQKATLARRNEQLRDAVATTRSTLDRALGVPPAARRPARQHSPDVSPGLQVYDKDGSQLGYGRVNLSTGAIHLVEGG